MRAGTFLGLCLAPLAACGGSEAPPPGGAAAPAEPLAGFDCTFEDATARSGIAFVHQTGGTGGKLLPETMGSGAALLDYDTDGALDLFLVNSGALPGAEAGADARCALYRGRGDATFEDVSQASRADIALYGMGAAAADYDGDGDPDIYVTALGENALLQNRSLGVAEPAGHRPHRFTDEARAAGVEGGKWTDRDGVEHPSWSTAAAWLDADVDGDLDLFVGGYCCWTPELEIFTTLDGVHKAFTTPDRYEGLPSLLYLNLGAGFFEPSTDAFNTVPGRALGAAACDLDGDGRDELLVAHDTRPNALLWNRGGHFEDVAERAAIAYDPNGRARAGMGIDVADLAGDGHPFLAIGNFAGEPLSFYRYGAEAFEDWSRRSGLESPSIPHVTFGLAFLDADLDGQTDLLLANGHIEPDIAAYRPDQRYAQPAQLFRGLGGGRFADATAAAGPGFGAPRVGRGLAAGDLDGDGDLDLVVTQNGGAPAVLLNRAQETRHRHFLRVVLRGAGKNRDALGAVITLQAGGRIQRRSVHTGSSYLSQGELAATFGLGDGAAVERLEVRWPGGATAAYPVPGVDRTLELAAP